ncbi:hypothetical protein [Dactylosporangium sp. NPDC050588]|uniref:hypothetical protein n=1 Tax=Dactylosporangium sp. NPDC050588 TaxID=3157211 RepID=UPI0033F74E52
MTDPRYLIGYIYKNHQVGHIELTLNAPISTMAEVQAIQAELRTHLSSDNLLIVSFSRFADTGNGGAR